MQPKSSGDYEEKYLRPPLGPRFQQCSSGNEHTCLPFSQLANTPSISHRSLFTSYLAYAFIAGPSAPGDVPPSMHRVISARYFDYICLPSARAAITYSSSFVRQDPNGLHMVNWWRERLNQDDVRNVSCLEIREVEGRIFDVQSVLFTSKQASFY